MCHHNQQAVLWILRANPSPTPYSGIKLHLIISIVTKGRAGGISYEMLESESHSVVPDSLSPRGLYSSWNSLGQNIGVGSQFPPPGDLPNPGIEPMSPTLQVNSSSAEPPRKPKNTGVGSLSLLQCVFLTQELNWSLLQTAGGFFTSWAIRKVWAALISEALTDNESFYAIPILWKKEKKGVLSWRDQEVNLCIEFVISGEDFRNLFSGESQPGIWT